MEIIVEIEKEVEDIDIIASDFTCNTDCPSCGMDRHLKRGLERLVKQLKEKIQ